MDVISESSPANRLFARQAQVLMRPMTQARRMANVIRDLVVRTSGPPPPGLVSLPLGMADVATALWTRFHKFDAADPRWPDRDRFVLSAGHRGILLHALIYLTGFDGLSIDDVRDFHQPLALPPGHLGFGDHPAIETTAGPFGQGLATAVGIALAERNMAARFGKSLVDHRTWVIAAAGDLMAGVSHEAAGLAGHLGLSKLTVLYDDAATPADADTDLPYPEDVLKRFSAYGWATRRVDGHDPDEISAALSFAVRSRKPTVIACRTNTGPVTPAMAEIHGIDGLTEGAAPSAGTHQPLSTVSGDLRRLWHAAGSRGAAARRSWLKRLARNSQRGEFDRVLAGRLPDTWHEAMTGLKQQIADDRPKFAGQASSQKCLEALVPATPELISASANPAGTGLMRLPGITLLGAGHFSGRYMPCGGREHAMAAAANGMALHGGIIPVIGASLMSSDAVRPAMRLAAVMRQRVVYVMSHDPVELCDEGPAHQPLEHLATLRAMPNLYVFCPGDTMETAECFELALRRSDGPSLLVVSPQTLPAWRTDASENRCARGGYVLAEADGPRQATVIATGSEVSIAMVAREKLAGDNIAAAVVSLPCWALFALQDEAYRAQVLGGAPRVGIEAASGFGWDHWLGPDGTFIGVTGFRTAANDQDPYHHSEVTPEAVVAAVMRHLG
jgi:transketolase